METSEIIKALNRLKVETGSLVCLGCGHEHNCGVHGCAILRETVGLLEKQEKQIQTLKATLSAMERDFRTAAGGWNECEFCAHCCIDEKPAYRLSEKYLEYCNQCVDGSCFEWRGVMPGSTKNGEISES